MRHTAKRIEQIEVHTRLDLLVLFHSTHSCSYILVYISWVSLGIASIFFGSFGGIRLPTPPTRKTIGNATSIAIINKHAIAKIHIRLHPSIVNKHCKNIWIIHYIPSQSYTTFPCRQIESQTKPLKICLRHQRRLAHGFADDVKIYATYLAKILPLREF